MKRLASKLIKLGYDQPDLQPHLRPILDKVANLSLLNEYFQDGEEVSEGFEAAGRRGKQILEKMPGVIAVSVDDSDDHFLRFTLQTDAMERVGRSRFEPFEVDLDFIWERDKMQTLQVELGDDHSIGTLTIDYMKFDLGPEAPEADRFDYEGVGKHVAQLVLDSLPQMASKAMAFAKRITEVMSREEVETLKKKELALKKFEQAMKSYRKALYLSFSPLTGREKGLTAEFFHEDLPESFGDYTLDREVQKATADIKRLLTKALSSEREVIQDIEFDGHMSKSDKLFVTLVLK